MCIARAEAGFPHAAVQRYPANMRGVLFQFAEDRPVSAENFEISSPDDARLLKPTLEPVSLPPGSAAAAELPRGTQLVRVMVEGGYRPGRSYSVRYTGERELPAQYPDSTAFQLGLDRLELKAEDVVIVPGEAAVREHTLRNGDTGQFFIAATRRINFALSPPAQAYRDALALLPEAAGLPYSQGESCGFVRLYPSASACNGRGFGAAYRDQAVTVYQQCDRLDDAQAVRASVGFLEIDDRIVQLNAAGVEWGPAVRANCTPPGVLSAAVRGSEPHYAARLMCDLDRSGTGFQSPGLHEIQIPTADEFVRIAAGRPWSKVCAVRFIAELMTHAHTLPESLPPLFARLASEESVVAGNPELAGYLLAKLSLWRGMDQAGRQLAWRRSELRPLLPLLLSLSNDPGSAAPALQARAWIGE